MLGGLGPIALLVVPAAVALTSVPVVGYYRYFALLDLGDTEPDLDVIADRQAAVRADGVAE